MLRKFHQSNGGEDAWNKQSAVRFRYEVELGGHTGKVVLPEIVLRLGDYRHVWVRREGDPQPVRLVLGESPAIEDSLALEFQDYRKVSGVEIAHVRTHSVLEPEVFDPFEDATEPPTWILRETLRHVVFLSREEADQRYPVVDPGHEAR